MLKFMDCFKTKLILLLFTELFFSCNTKKTLVKEKDFGVQQIVVNQDIDNLLLNELRFYKTKSALDVSKLCYDSFGKWNSKIAGKHQDNINTFIWEKKYINGNPYTLLADGTETQKESFSCLMVFDKNGLDCFKNNHPKKEELIEFFAYKMKGINRSKTSYLIFK